MKNVNLFKMLFIASTLIFSSCEDKDDDLVVCPELFFEITQENDFTYIFEADFENRDSLSYEWYIDGEFIANENSSRDTIATAHQLYRQFEEGTYAVCIKAETPDCPNGMTFCKEITIGDSNDLGCADLWYSNDGDYLYADYRGAKDDALYTWYVNGEEISPFPNPRDNTSKFPLEKLDSGAYKICVTSRIEGCDAISEFCEEVIIENKDKDCPELTLSRDGDYLYADYRGADDTTIYSWFVNGQETNDSTRKFPLIQVDAGTYRICVTSRIDGCDAISETCKEVIIDDTSDCPELFFEAIKENPNYYSFIADFEGRDALTYEWFINGEYIDSDGVNSTTLADHRLEYQFGAGTYEICIMAETPDCPKGIRFCKTIEIE